VAPSIRIFLSSPGDVDQERLRANLVIQKLAREYARFFALEPYLWEYEPMLASGTFQDAIEPPSDYDIVVLVLWSRLGTPLPEKTAIREYRGIDGRVPVTGTEWEFENALAANRATGGKGPPDLLVYRRDEDPKVSLKDEGKRNQQLQQFDALTAFWRRWFKKEEEFLSAFSEYKTLDDFDRKLDADLSKLVQRYIKERRVQYDRPIWLKGSPFRGLDAYEFEDAKIFFGRDQEITEALTLLSAAAKRGTAFLLVSGPSGSGKSSLARAGLLPGLTAPNTTSGVGLWRRVVMRPADADGDPVLAIARALLSGDASRDEGLPELTGPNISAVELAHHLRSTGDPKFIFKKTLLELSEAQRRRKALLPHEEARLIIVIDQLEELFTRPEILAEDRKVFCEIIEHLSESGAVWVIATMRSDFLYRGLESTTFRELVQKGARVDLATPDVAQIMEMIRQPAEAAGLSFDDDPNSGLRLDALIAKDAGQEPGSLPLLSVMLEDIYRRDVMERGTGGVLTSTTYMEFGGLREAIGRRADDVLRRLAVADADVGKAVPGLLRAVVTTDLASNAFAARATPIRTFQEGSPEWRLVKAFLAPDVRLLTAEDRGSGPEIRLAHEALIENWPLAKAWIEENRRDLETESILRALMRSHTMASKDEKDRTILAGVHLELGLKLIARGLVSKDSDLGSFISESARDQRRIDFYRIRAAIEAQQARWAESGRRRDLLLPAGIRLAEGEFILRNYGTEVSVDVRRFITLSKRRASRTQTLVASSAIIFSLISIVAIWQWKAATDQRAQTQTQRDSAETALRSATLANLRSASVISPDGHLLLALDPNGQVKAIDLASDRQVGVIAVDNGEITSVAFSPDGARIATGATTKEVGIWDAATLKEIAVLNGATTAIRRVKFSPDGDLLASGGDDNTARVWSVKTGQELHVIPVSLPVIALAFSPDGKNLTVYSDGGIVYSVDLATGAMAIGIRG
jgi:energy-coupling factor transporter ATP-binding protein EcfA2